ncbi:MAG: hypothetical protein KDC93_11145 [Cyclobacteriaceae bacterium]|nr:hypothetical protein [Cyclobacteriaceae bacterium]
MKNWSFISSSISLAIILFVTGAFSQETSHVVQDALEYYTKRAKAIYLAKSGSWE